MSDENKSPALPLPFLPLLIVLQAVIPNLLPRLTPAEDELPAECQGHPATIATAKSLQSCPTLCDPIPGILQARALEWVAISFSNA